MAQFTDIPNEIILQFFAYLPLRALIAARGVNRHWRQLVLHAEIYPPRRALLDLYLEILESPLFVPTRPWVVDRLRPFDRQGYLDTLLEQHPYLPEEFCTWVLEWPARAAIRTAWPGLPVERIDGENWLGSNPPELSVMEYFGHVTCEAIPALCLWTEHTLCTWLVLDERIGPRGKVYELYTTGNFLATEEGTCKGDAVYANFIDWQRHLWRKVEKEAAYRTTDVWAEINAATYTEVLGSNELAERPIPEIPAPPWRNHLDFFI